MTARAWMVAAAAALVVRSSVPVAAETPTAKASTEPAPASRLTPATPRPPVERTPARPARTKSQKTRSDTAKLSADELEARALDLGRRSNRGRAIEFLERAIKLEPKRARLQRHLGVLYRDTGRMAKAERCFRKATSLDAKDAAAWSNLAAILERSGSQKDALKAANRAVALAPKDAGMRADRAIIRYRLGQVDAAIDDGTAALKELSDAPRFEVDLALMRLTRGKRGDITAALALLTRARAVLSDDPAVALAHAQALMVARRTQPAIKAYDALLTRNPRQAWANWGRGLLAWRESRWELAKKHGGKARRVLPHVFTSRGHNRRRFFSKDSRGYLRWLDDELGPSVQSKSVPGGPAVLETLKVRGGCEREAIRKSLNAVAAPVRACFGGRAGRIEVRFTAGAGRAKGVNQAAGSVSRDADRCILGVMRKATMPAEATCRVVAAWNRPIQPPAMTHKPAIEAVLPKAAILPPRALDALVPPKASDKPSHQRH